MDDYHQTSQQNENPMRPMSNSQYQQQGNDASQQQESPQLGSSSNNDRQRTVPTRGRPPASYSGYYQPNTPDAYSVQTGVSQDAINYAQQTAEYGHSARQPQHFAAAYNPTATGMIYGVQAPGQGAVFDASQQFSSRQHAGMAMMPSSVNPVTYYAGDSAVTTAAISTQVASPSGPSSGSMYDQQNPTLGRSSMAQGYSTGMDTIIGSSGMVTQATGENPILNQPGTEIQDNSDLNEAYAIYQKALRDIFKNIKNGALVPAAESLLEKSEWLLTSVEALGLTVDSEELYGARMKLWKNFNNAWLALFAKQRELMLRNTQIQRSQSVLPLDVLRKMGRELVRLCDGVERFGLVDYEYGVWEERIMAILTECVHLVDFEEEGGGGEASTSASR